MYFIIFIISFVLRFYLIRSLYWVESLIPSWFRVLLFTKYPFPNRITSSPNINMDVTLLFLNRWWLWMRKTLVFLSLRFWCEANFPLPFFWDSGVKPNLSLPFFISLSIYCYCWDWFLCCISITLKMILSSSFPSFFFFLCVWYKR